MPIDVLPGAEEDLDELESLDPEALAVVLAVLDEAEADPAIAQILTTWGNAHVGEWLLNVKPWVVARARGNNLFRFRVLDTAATSYRVVYGYDWRSQRIGVLAIVHKEDFDYGLKSTLSDRIIDDWRAATDQQDT
jgi:mRNA-degrading endonuclease RelE of RelBE toxin-antitoxin system